MLVTAQRTMAIPLGRGLFKLGTHQPIITQAISIPVLNLEGKTRQDHHTLKLEDAQLSKGSLVWPNFHNGVAAGLRIARAGKAKLSTTWIAYHR